ncbi:hypothetical protein CAOG_04278 [Capsaspora owczarzaki ATCC 30864]|uniref:Uncharacterized protein n=1 Tax=Capsaspora owczarzaki (strain ATCC 30864) TaxID=595528 RepID=A0A0D2VRJ0_CAPO3|nr:hypothetical protein CAOG_04278 [Capsaspora owczarzaki ATCC 30864]KJE93492.1 hypothetical protein CAOG_004278 [Capsaspora owczarzaki ATCC 30864]|eukprot:XP_004348103.1 hypothetical protein CAOG_04278 [Capsaspora owczarzaki ATCC 30864]
MTWGDELWDQNDAIANHTQEGVEFLNTYAKFLKERARIESEFGGSIRKLVKQFVSDTIPTKKKGEADEQSTGMRAWATLLSETEDIAKQHEVIGETLSNSLVEPAKNLAKDVSAERKKHLAESARLQANMKKQLDDLDKVKKNYEKCCKEAEAAKIAYEKAGKDMNMTKAQEDKFKVTWQQKQKLAEDAQAEYLIMVEKTNQVRKTYYYTDMPSVFTAMQRMEEDRTAKMATMFAQYADVERSTMSIVTTCLNNMTTEAGKVQPSRDTQLFIEDHKSGFQIPADVQYAEYGAKAVAPPPSAAIARVGTTKKKTGGLFGKKKKDDGSDDFSDLPPEKRKKRIGQKITELETEIGKEQKKKDSLDNMIKLYTEKPQLADEKAMAEARQQLAETAKTMDSLGKELYKFQCYLAAFENMAGGAPATPSRGGISRMESASSSQQDEDEDFPTQSCRALYDFAASGEGELSLTANETLTLLENDGSGWARVARGDDEGYVPESYIEII